MATTPPPPSLQRSIPKPDAPLRAKLPTSTPIKGSIHSFEEFAYEPIQHPDVQLERAIEMSGCFLGPMPPGQFIDDFAKLDENIAEPEFLATVFASMNADAEQGRESPSGKSKNRKKNKRKNPNSDSGLGSAEKSKSRRERALYAPLVNCITESNICPSLTFANTSSRWDPNDPRRLQPDITAYASDPSVPESGDNPDDAQTRELSVPPISNLSLHDDTRTPASRSTSPRSIPSSSLPRNSAARNRTGKIKASAAKASKTATAKASKMSVASQSRASTSKYQASVPGPSTRSGPSVVKPQKTDWGKLDLTFELKSGIERDGFKDPEPKKEPEGTESAGQVPVAGSVGGDAGKEDPGDKRQDFSRSHIYHPKYTDPPYPYDFERQGADAIETRGQLTTYATAQWGHQHVTHLFQILVMGNYARLLRWDRSGAIVTERFDYRDTPHLARFLWRFDRMSAAARGKDTTVTEASPEEAELAKRTLVGEFKEWVDDQKPILKFQVGDPENPQYFLASRPKSVPDSPIGRGSKGYIAVELAEPHRIVWLKNSWRVVADKMRPEGEIYEELHSHNVPHIPAVLVHGDVPVQKTKTLDYINEPWVGEVRLTLALHILNRLVLLDIGVDLTKVRCSKVLVKAVGDALKAHQVACDEAKQLHRDMSPNNILSREREDGTTEGLLIDWDLSRPVNSLDTEQARVNGRTGTWQFISGSILQDPTKMHTRTDDIESTFWIILWVLLHYVHCNREPVELGDIMNSVFDEREWKAAPRMYAGGSRKQLLLLERTNWDSKGRGPIRFDNNQPMNDLMEALLKLWRAWYGMFVIEDPEIQAILRKTTCKLDDETEVIRLIEEACQKEGWPAADFGEDRIPQRPRHNTAQAGPSKARKTGHSDTAGAAARRGEGITGEEPTGTSVKGKGRQKI